MTFLAKYRIFGRVYLAAYVCLLIVWVMRIMRKAASGNTGTPAPTLDSLRNGFHSKRLDVLVGRSTCGKELLISNYSPEEIRCSPPLIDPNTK